MIIDTGNILLIGSILLFISILAGKAGYRFGVPMLLLFLGVGMFFGSDGLGIQFNNSAAAQFIGMMALSIILFSGGMDTKYSEIKPIAGPGIMLATIGVLLTALLTGTFIYYISGVLTGIPSLSFTESLLLAAVMSSTDSASVFSILRSKGLKLKENLRPMLELESGSNDPMAYMLTILLIQIIQFGDMSFMQAVLMLLQQFIIGGLFGYILGRLALVIINRLNIDNEAFYPILLLACVFFVFAFTDLCNGNGYLAVYIAGLVIGNHKILHKKSIRTFFDGFAWLFQLIMFLTLGLLVNPTDLLPVAGIGLLVGAAMILLTRPISVWLSLLPFRKISTRAKFYVSWVGLRGAVPIIFATYPLIAGLEHAPTIFNIVFFITILSLLVQGTTVNYAALLLKLGHVAKAPKKEFGIELPEEIKSTMTELTVIPAMLVNGDRLMDIDLPDNTLAVMVKRRGQFFIPSGKTQLASGDILLLLSDSTTDLHELRHKQIAG